MSEDRNPRFEISDGSNRVQLGVGNYLLALNAGDVYETGDIAEVEALDKNAHVERTFKDATRAYEAYDPEANDGLPQPADFVNPVAYVEEAPEQSLEERFASDAKTAIGAVNGVSDHDTLDELETTEKARSTPRTTVLTAIAARREALPVVVEELDPPKDES